MCINLGISKRAMDEGSQFQQERDVPEVSVVTPHMFPGDSGRDNVKSKKSRGPPEGISYKNNKNGYRGVQSNTTFPLSGRENIPKRARRERKKEGIFLIPRQQSVQPQTVIHLAMNQRSKDS